MSDGRFAGICADRPLERRQIVADQHADRSSGLAKVSSTPGKTRLINHFKINAKWYLVDLPGYGYARVSKKPARGVLEADYRLRAKREAMVFLFVLIDSRLDPQKIDLDFIRMLGEHGVPFGLIFTKCDKQSDDRTSSMAKFRRKMLETWEELPPVFRTSSEKRPGGTMYSILSDIVWRRSGIRNETVRICCPAFLRWIPIFYE